MPIEIILAIKNRESGLSRDTHEILEILTSGIVIGCLRWVWLCQSVGILGRLNIVALHELGKLKTFYRFHSCLHQNSDFLNWFYFFENKKMLKFHVLETLRIELFCRKSRKMSKISKKPEVATKIIQEIQQSRKWWIQCRQKPINNKT